MIIRPEQHWFLRLFDWHGSVLSKIIFRLLLNVLMSIIAIISYQWYEQLGIHLTVAPFSLLGIAIAIFLGFRNSASYSRFVEARNLWGTVLIAERTLVRQLRNILPAEHDAHRRIVSYLVAFSWSLKHQLRKTDPTADLRRLLPEERVTEILASSMPTNRILLLAGNEIGQLREAGKLSDITYGLMDNKLDELAHVLGGCERLATTPVPFAYTLILQRTVYHSTPLAEPPTKRRGCSSCLPASMALTTSPIAPTCVMNPPAWACHSRSALVKAPSPSTILTRPSW